MELTVARLQSAPKLSLTAALQGTLPQALASLGRLRQFVVNGNDLSGSIPAYVGSYPGMGEAWLPRNNLSGPLDPSLCQSSGSGDNIHLQASSPLLCNRSHAGDPLERSLPMDLFLAIISHTCSVLGSHGSLNS